MTRVTIPFEHAITLSDAIQEAEAEAEAETVDEEILAFQFENPHLVGEYSPSAGTPVEEYLRNFEARYGTAPQITGVVVARDVDPNEAARGRTEKPIPVRAPKFVAPPARALDGTMAETAPQTMEVSSAPDWRPNVMTGDLRNTGSTRTLVQTYHWSDGSSSDQTPLGFGLEFGVELWNRDSGVLGARPNCQDLAGQPYLDYKDRSWASNYGWSWTVADNPNGGPIAPASIGAYADYNDLSDDCGRNSMTVGIRYPQALLQNSAGGFLRIEIEAPAGILPSSVAAGVVQPVSDEFCTTPVGSLYSLTDCMGVYAGSWPSSAGPQFRLTLNEDRAWQSPALCWTSAAKGEEPSVRTPCPENQLRLAGWGGNYAGELGVGSSDVPVSAASPIPGGGLAGLTFAGVSSSNTAYTNCAILTEDAYCWGYGSDGQLGNGSWVDSVSPVAVDDGGALAGRAVTQIETTFMGTCAIADGAPFCWGSSNYTGGGYSATPVAIDISGALAGKTVTDIAPHDLGVCVIADFAPYCWGYAYVGLLGNGTTGWTYQASPVPVDMTGALSGKQVSDIVAGTDFVCAIAEYRAYCWGDNNYGELGNGSTVDSAVPIAVGGPLGDLNVTSLSGGYVMCAVAEGDAYCWGRGSDGLLGTGVAYPRTGTSSHELLPRKVDDGGVLLGKTVTHIATGDVHGCVLADGQPFCWGENRDGALGNAVPANTLAWSPVAIDTTGGPLEGIFAVGLTVGGGSTIVAYPK
ncbi:RCC1 domain-containing protein [Agromyces bauzanensis]